MIEKYHGDKSKITACVIKESPANWFEPFETMKYDLMVVETIFSARLAEDTFRGIYNFVRATLIDTPIAEIEKALVSVRKMYIQMHATEMKRFVLIYSTGISIR